MFAKVKRFIYQHDMIRPNDTVIVAVSGGPDSMALLHILQQLQSEMELRLAVAHLNHGLRPEADSEQLIVEDYCSNHGIECFSRILDVKEIAARDGKSLEEAGRDCRYEFFHQLSHDLSGALIATAHHGDDRAEGVLLNLVRGTGIKGLRSIMPVNGRIIRPLLAATRDEIMTYLKENAVPYCIDNSNYDQTYLRNRIRWGLLPYLLSEFNPGIVKGLNQLAELAAGENEWMEQHCDKCWGYTAWETDSGVILRVPHLREMHQAMQRRIIMRALAHFGGEAGWGMDDVAYVQTLLAQTGSSKAIHLRKGIRVKKVYDELRFTAAPEAEVAFRYDVLVPGQLYIAETGQTLSFEVRERSPVQGGLDEILLDYDKLKKEERLVLRSREPGDYFHPVNGSGGKKLKEFFIDIKLPHDERNRVPVLAGEHGDIYALIGYRVAQAAAIDQDTKRVLLIRSRI